MIGPPMVPPNWLWISTGLMPRVGLKKPTALRGVTQEVVDRAVELVRPTAQAGVDDRAARAPVLGAEVVGLDLELLQRVGRGLHDLVREALVASAVKVVVNAVKHEVVERAAQAVDVEAGVARARFLGAEDRTAHAGREQRQVGVRAPVEGQVDDLLTVDDLAAVARF